jgi:amidase
LKPTRGRTPIGPDVGDALNGLGIEFALTRTVRDCAALLDAVQGGEAGDAYQIAAPPRPYASEIQYDPGRLRIAWMERPWSGVEIDPEIKHALADTIKHCAALGHELVEARPEFDYEDYINATHILWTTNLAVGVEQVAALTRRAIDSSNLEATTLACIEDGRKYQASDLLWALSVMNTITRGVAAFYQNYDVLLSPVMARPAPPLGTIRPNDPNLDGFGWTTTVFALCPYTALFNMTGQPAISLPLARTAGNLPIGMQFAGRYGAEGQLLRLARQLEQAHPWPQIAPLLA